MDQPLKKILGEMATTLKEGMGIRAPDWVRDMAVFVATPERVIAAIDNELHLGSASEMLLSLLGPDGIAMEEGDAAVSNDPYLGSPHLQDFYLLAPVHYKGKLVLYLGAKTHLPDIGGDIQGGFNPRAEEIWAEGVRITPLKICRQGQSDTGILNMILLNSRTPDPTRKGLESMMAAAEAGRKEALSCIRGSDGAESVLNEAEKIIQDTETRLREVVSLWPSGEYLGNCMVEDDSVKVKGLEIETKLLVKDSQIEIDLSTNRPQLKAPINSPRGNTLSFTLIPFLPLLHAGISANGGIWTVITVKTKKGTLVDPVLPAPTSFSPFHVGQEVSGAVRACMEKFLLKEERDRLARRFSSLVNWHPKGL